MFNSEKKTAYPILHAQKTVVDISKSKHIFLDTTLVYMLNNKTNIDKLSDH